MDVQGISLLGGDPNGLNFEIEYLDSHHRHREALYSVRLDLCFIDVQLTSDQQIGTLRLTFANNEVRTIRLPDGLNWLVEVRKPLAVGGETIKEVTNALRRKTGRGKP